MARDHISSRWCLYLLTLHQRPWTVTVRCAIRPCTDWSPTGTTLSKSGPPVFQNFLDMTTRVVGASSDEMALPRWASRCFRSSSTHPESSRRVDTRMFSPIQDPGQSRWIGLFTSVHPIAPTDTPHPACLYQSVRNPIESLTHHLVCGRDGRQSAQHCITPSLPAPIPWLTFPFSLLFAHTSTSPSSLAYHLRRRPSYRHPIPPKTHHQLVLS